MTGRTIAHYQVLEKLGEGGMGVVYKARDTHLDRLVAIKVLPPERLADAGRKRRFVQEAKAASALSHPNIVTIHDIDRRDGLDYICMEYVHGKTLGQLIGRKGLALSDALKYGVQVADALSCAHAAGILHRDLKPGNVMVSEEGQVKVLDFGLAKLTEEYVPDEDESTRTAGQVKTEEGTVVGTVNYMSPEQAEGKNLDARSDIFSFGALLYEMLTGERAFRGASRMSTLAAVIREEPRSITEIAGKEVPHEVARIVTRCLRKDPARRFQIMADLKVSLAELKDESDSGSLQAAAAPRKRRARWRWVAAVLALGAAIGAGAWYALRPVSPRIPNWRVRRITSDEAVSTWSALSPDGKLIAFVSDRSGRGRKDLFIQQAAVGSPVPLSDGKRKIGPLAFSPDGAQIAFETIGDEGSVYVIPVIGGEPRFLAERLSGSAGYLSFSPDGKWICTMEETGLFRFRYLLVPAAGGEAKLLTPKLYINNRFVWSPDSRGILVEGAETQEDYIGGNADLWFVGLDGSMSRTGARPLLASAGLDRPRLVAWNGNRLLFSAPKGGPVDLWQIRLPYSSKKAAGAPRPLTSGWADRTVTSVSAEGDRLLFEDMSDRGNSRIWALPLDAETGKAAGKAERISTSLNNEGFPSALDGGRRLLFDRWDGQKFSVLLRDFAARKDTPIVEGSTLGFPVVSRDGARFAYVSFEGQKRAVYVSPVRGGAPRRLCAACGRPTGWSPDGTRLLAHDLGGKPGQAGFIDVATGETRTLLEHPQRIYNPVVSPDGRWIVFSLRPPGPERTFVAPYREDGPIPQAEWTLLREGPETYFHWSPGGGMLYFLLRRPGDYRISIWALPFDKAAGKAAGEAFLVFEPEDWRLTPWGDQALIGLSPAPDRLFFAQTEIRVNIWLAEAGK